MLLKPEHEHQVSNTDSHRRRASGDTCAREYQALLRLLRGSSRCQAFQEAERREESISGGAGVSPREEVRVSEETEEQGAGRAGGHEEHWEGPEQGKTTGALWARGTQSTAPGGAEAGVRATRTPHESATAKEQPSQTE